MHSTVASNLLGVLFELGQPRIMKSTVTLQRIFAELQSKIGSLFDDRSDDQRIPHMAWREKSAGRRLQPSAERMIETCCCEAGCWSAQARRPALCERHMSPRDPTHSRSLGHRWAQAMRRMRRHAPACPGRKRPRWVRDREERPFEVNVRAAAKGGWGR